MELVILSFLVTAIILTHKEIKYKRNEGNNY